MKNLINTLIFTILFSVFGFTQNYQFTTSFGVQGNKTVVLELVTTGVQINNAGSSPYSCPNGYNFDILFDYTIKCYNDNNWVEVGFNHFYTLRGVFVCDNDTIPFNLPNQLGNGSDVTTGNIWTNQTNCNTVTVENLICNEIIFEVDAKGYNGPGFITVTGTSTLPIELVDYFVVSDGTDVVINWSTGSEINNDYFTIERSYDGYFWESIVTIAGMGNSSNMVDYTYRDRDVNGNLIYYRLSQTDFDGTTEVFDIKSVIISDRKVLRITNLLGQNVDMNFDGIKIVIFDNGEQIKLH